MPWDKLKSLFVVKEHKDLAAFELPPDAPAEPPPAVAVPAGAQIDFQALYDQAGIPNTDEVEALEKFLGGLDMDLPQASKVAASKAFLNAIGKAPSDVLEDAARKIQVVRVVEDAKRAEGAKVLADQQGAIDALQKEIEAHRQAMEAAQREMESARSQCAVEEARLQGARTFFGHVGQVPAKASRSDS